MTKNMYHYIIKVIALELDARQIPYTINECWEGYQLRFPWCNGDVAIHDSTYGHIDGYVETYCFPWDNGDVSMLTPLDAARNIIKYYYEKY